MNGRVLVEIIVIGPSLGGEVGLAAEKDHHHHRQKDIHTHIRTCAYAHTSIHTAYIDDHA